MRNSKKFHIILPMLFFLFIRCEENSEEKFYLDYNEAMNHSDSSIRNLVYEKRIARLFNKNDTILVIRNGRKKFISNLKDIDSSKFRSIDFAISLMSERMIDSTISGKSVPKFIIINKRDISSGGSVELIPVKQAFALSKDRFHVDNFQ